MKSPPLRPLWLLALALVAACGPEPSGVDATMPRRDSGSADRALADRSGSDRGRSDARVDDGARLDGAADAIASDHAVASDTRQPDRAPPDTVRRDAIPFAGPYQATDLPKVIDDAATNNQARSTDTLIYARDNAATPFVDVYVVITHQDAHDLTVLLIPPVGSSSELFNGDSCSPGSCPAPLTIDTRRNVGGSTLGNWVLRITDRFTGQTGMLQSYQLTFTR